MIRLDSRQENGKTIITLEGSATIEHAEEIKQELLNQFKESDGIELDLKKIDRADISFLQLLESACKTCVSSEKAFSITNNRFPDLIEGTIISAGFFKQKQCILNPETPCRLSEITQEGEQ